MKKVTLTNDFHGTKITIELADDGWLTDSQAKRVRGNLCGSPDCTCGDSLGTRGPQEFVEIDHAYDNEKIQYRLVF